ncbi:MAG: hypothetical protein ABR512_13870 [Desulfopila sp.]
MMASIHYPMEHTWDVSPAQAKTIKEERRQQIVPADDFDRIPTVAGVDVGVAVHHPLQTAGKHTTRPCPLAFLQKEAWLTECP